MMTPKPDRHRSARGENDYRLDRITFSIPNATKIQVGLEQ
jgi:hypothetical protein